jgi:hypothetical protein
MGDGMAELWSDYTDIIITDMDSALGAKYGKVNVRKFLSSPAKYAALPNISSDAQRMKSDANEYLDGVLEGLSEQKARLDDGLLKADSLTGQLSQSISMLAKQNRIPVIKPAFMERNTADDQVIYIDSVDSGVAALIEKLVANAVYIADRTDTYENRRVGEWLFGGQNSYIVKVYVPQNEVMLVQGAKDEINSLFDVAINFVKSPRKGPKG